MENGKMLNIRGVCEMLQTSRTTLWNIRQQDKTFPPGVQLTRSGVIRFSAQRIRDWLRSREAS